MSNPPEKRLKSCFIAAPAGLDLGALPDVLSEKAISWEWAKAAPGRVLRPSDAISHADFLIGIFDGSRSDYQVFYETGIAVGQGKPILLITNGRRLPFDVGQLPTAKIPLKSHSALAFHLDIFLKAPKRQMPEEVPRRSVAVSQLVEPPQTDVNFRGPNSELESRAYSIVEACGGRAVAEPTDFTDKRYRPDLLAWLGHQDSELLDPTVLEVKARIDPKDTGKIEEKLLKFMQSTGIKTAFVLTSESPPPLKRRLSPYIYWLTLDEFEILVRDSRLSAYIRETRNRAMHGARDATS